MKNPIIDRNDKKGIAALINASVKTWNIDKEQATKRVNKLLYAIDNGMFDGIPKSGPSDYLQSMFVQVKCEQIMTTQVD